MKKLGCIAMAVALLSLLMAFNVSAAEAPGQNITTDPYYDYHLSISAKIDEMRELRNSQIETKQKAIEELRTRSMELYENSVNSFSAESQTTYNEIIKSIDLVEEQIKTIQSEYFDNVYSYLRSVGMEIIDTGDNEEINGSIHLSATDAGNMQTTSSVSYSTLTDEFYYFVEYDYNQQNLVGTYVGLNDMWGDYDLVSMQHRENSDWYWDNIIVTANLANGFYGNSLVGKADKYQILDAGFFGTNSVSNREDLWNGCIFNVKDSEVTGAQNFSSEIRYVTLEGWLKPTGTETSVQVKSEYEHNYQKLAWNSVTIGSTDLDDPSFSLEVIYEVVSGVWRRSAGSRLCTIPD